MMATGDTSAYLSTIQAAAVLGVSVSTVKRWVDEGVLPAHRTAGGHRKLYRAEVLALARRGELPRGDLAMADLCTADAGAPPLEALSTTLAQALLTGEARDARAVIHRAYDAGLAMEVVADSVIAPALARVGHDWETAQIDVWEEHRGTQLCAAALYELHGEMQARAERNRPVAVGGAPEGDPYLLPSLLAQYVLLDAGWDAVNLGPNTPLPSLAEAARELRPRLLWLSASHVADEVAFLDAYRALYKVAERHGIAVAIGGQALHEGLRARLPYTTYGDSLAQLAAFARTLHPRPRPPRRGRPAAPGPAV